MVRCKPKRVISGDKVLEFDNEKESDEWLGLMQSLYEDKYEDTFEILDCFDEK